MKTIKTFNLFKINEGILDFFNKETKETSKVTPDYVKNKYNLLTRNNDEKLKKEAIDKFPSVVKLLDNMLKNTPEQMIEVKQNPTFNTKSTNTVNYFLLHMIEEEYKNRGFRTQRSYDGRDFSKHDWFRILV